ncbi:hypothetical protein GP486_001111 [Trichoglossum hirsutum]|uniref:Uncharacterized protein n=1 Tax=Trichoglossum hirsutum TaxID=265104 RepID=A0A9P8RT01_9PEZI|nr:hypothetical protein GP486_001111 [Trichoglossum hirsutum]
MDEEDLAPTEQPTTPTSPNAAWFRAYKSTLDKLSRGDRILPLSPILDIRIWPTATFLSPTADQELSNFTSRVGPQLFARANSISPAGPPSSSLKGAISGPVQAEGSTGFGSSCPQNIDTNFGALDNMVIERDSPSKARLSPQKDIQRPYQPQFGSSSPLQSALPKAFNIPPKNKPRPEHHRPSNNGINASDGLRHPHSLRGDEAASGALTDPFRPRQPTGIDDRAGSGAFNPRHENSGDKEVQEIPRPMNQAFSAVRPSEWRTFSSLGGTNRGFIAINQSTGQKAPIDLTGGSKDSYGIPSGAADKFGAIDTDTYINPTKTAETIKALLEGAFDDDDDKPKTRSRKKKQAEEVIGLIDRTKNLSVGENGDSGESKGTSDRDEEEEEEEEEEDGDDGTVVGLNVKLLPHQVQGVQWMREKERGKPKGGILADDMGLGKTLQSIALVLTNPLKSSPPSDKDKSGTPAKSTLVVAPLALIKQWEKEIKDRVSGSHRLRVCVHHGPNRTKDYQDLQRYDVVITTYQILASEHAGSSDKEGGLQVGCFGVHWYRVILDEAHSIKNHLAKSSKACYALRTRYRWCLTGTPMQNNLDELQSLIRFLKIKPYDDPKVWKEQITWPMKNGRGGTAIKRLQYFLKAVMKRRTKEVLKKDGALNFGGKSSKEGDQGGFRIAERKVEEIRATFSTEERTFYDRLEKRTDRSLEQMEGGGKLSYANALVLLLRLRQACNHPELVAGKLAKDKEALTVSDGVGQAPKKSKASATEVDDIADLLGGLTVETTSCEVCMLELSNKEMKGGAIRCSGCQDDVTMMRSRKRNHGAKGKSKSSTHRNRAIRHRPRVTDSDDEDDDRGEWIVPEEQRNKESLGKAGGTDDENSEGGGEWIGDEDTSVEGEEGDEEEEDYDSSDEAEISKLVISTKTEYLLKILHKETLEHKFIVFSQFTSMLDLIEPFLKRDGFNYTRYDGSMRNDQREASLDRLRNSRSCRILLCSLKCGSLGLNLTAASRVVILEPFWNPFIEEQAIDRVHRLNQTVDVVVYKITIANTVEERILKLQKTKRDLANATIEGKAVGKLSMKDIMSLFRHDHQGPPDPKDISLATKTRVLDSGSALESMGLRAGGSEQQQHGVRKVSHPMHKAQGGAAPLPPPPPPPTTGNSIWGRRW